MSASLLSLGLLRFFAGWVGILGTVCLGFWCAVTTRWTLSLDILIIHRHGLVDFGTKCIVIASTVIPVSRVSNIGMIPLTEQAILRCPFPKAYP